MKVALIDNMNNNFFALTRYFRDLGVEADLYLIPNRGMSHFDPDQDTWQDLRDVRWIKEFPIEYHWKYFIKPYRRILVEKFSGYDAVVACGPVVGLLNSAGITIDLFIPYGSDLFNIPFISNTLVSNHWAKKLPSLLINYCNAIQQKRGIQSAIKIISNTNWELAQNAIEKLHCSAINLPRVMVYKEPIPAESSRKYSWIDSHDFVVFSPTRHLWKTNADPIADFKVHGGMKRNDKLIRAFARLVKLDYFKKPLLIFCKYGADVNHSKDLIKLLEIQNYTKWLPILPRREIVVIMSKSTFVADQFRQGMSATSAGTTNEALAYGTPVITNTDGAIFKEDDPFYEAPILQATDEQEIYTYFVDYIERPAHFEKIGDLSSRWFDENLGMGLARKYLDLLDKCIG